MSKHKGEAKEALQLPMPKHELWSHDTIISTVNIYLSAAAPHQDKGQSDSEEDLDNDVNDELPDYLTGHIAQHSI